MVLDAVSQGYEPVDAADLTPTQFDPERRTFPLRQDMRVVLQQGVGRLLSAATGVKYVPPTGREIRVAGGADLVFFRAMSLPESLERWTLADANRAQALLKDSRPLREGETPPTDAAVRGTLALHYDGGSVLGQRCAKHPRAHWTAATYISSHIAAQTGLTEDELTRMYSAQRMAKVGNKT
jgi:hypothetical protein